MRAIKTNYESTTIEKGTNDVVHVAQIARELRMNPKHVRARLRRLYRNNDARVRDLQTIANHTWSFSRENESRVRALIASFAIDEANTNDDTNDNTNDT